MKTLLLIPIIFLSACKNDLRNMDKYFIEGAVEIKNQNFDSLCYPEIFQKAFSKDYKTTDFNENEIAFKTFDIGKIKITSGKLTAGDPAQIGKLTEFAESFPIGEFPVHISVTNDNQTAFSKINFNNDKVVRWELAKKSGQKKLDINDDKIYCFGCDGGIGLYIDMNSQEQLNNTGIDEIMEVTFMKFYDIDEDEIQFVNYHFNGHNLVCFQTGYGDGCYGSYIGYNDQNEVCQFLSDFQLIDWRK